MKINLSWRGNPYTADLSQPHSLAIPLRGGQADPNCYYSPPATMTPIRSGDFTGSIDAGAPVNHYLLSLSPHGNTTHTECYGHITAGGATINQCLTRFWFVAQLLSVTPTENGSDKVIEHNQLAEQLTAGIEALLVRTLPNSTDKLSKNYSGTNPPYFTADALQLLAERNIGHLVCDLPSVDKETDGGRLAAHKAFWQTAGNLRKGATITELAYMDNRLADGLYLLNLQVPAIALDAAPSRPVVYALQAG